MLHQKIKILCITCKLYVSFTWSQTQMTGVSRDEAEMVSDLENMAYITIR